MPKWPRLLRSTTFRLTLIYFGLFGVSAVVLVGFLYWSTAGFMARQTDEAIEAEIRGLAEQYSQFGTIGLVRALNRRTSRARASRGLYLLTDAGLRPLAGNLSAWPREESQPDGWITFKLEYADQRGAVDFGRARIFELTGGSAFSSGATSGSGWRSTPGSANPSAGGSRSRWSSASRAAC